MDTRRIFLSCQLSQGSFSGEVIFEVQTVAHGAYVGIAPRRDCFKPDGQNWQAYELPSGESAEGEIATHLIANGGEIARVALPDGEAVEVSATLVSERQSETSHEHGEIWIDNLRTARGRRSTGWIGGYRPDFTG